MSKCYGLSIKECEKQSSDCKLLYAYHKFYFACVPIIGSKCFGLSMEQCEKESPDCKIIHAHHQLFYACVPTNLPSEFGCQENCE